MDDMVYVYALCSALGSHPAMLRHLLENESPEFLFKLQKDELAELFNGNGEILGSICNPNLLDESLKEVEWAKSKGVQLLPIISPDYPQLLKECNDAPCLLFYIGSANLNQWYNVSVVGTRLATNYGRDACNKIVGELRGADAAIISGMAYGIDVCAHKAAMEYGLPTIGVLPCGIDSIYPKEHRDIARKMIENGGIITEFPRGTDVRRWQFIKRNRIIAGMGRCVIVVESRIKGGAMITAELAQSYGRDVYAVPGRLGDANSFGCNYLVSKDVARICLPYSLKENLGLATSSRSIATMRPDLFSADDDKKQKILLSLKNNLKADTDLLCRSTNLSFDDVAMALLELELEGLVTAVKGDEYKLCNPNAI